MASSKASRGDRPLEGTDEGGAQHEDLGGGVDELAHLGRDVSPVGCRYSRGDENLHGDSTPPPLPIPTSRYPLFPRPEPNPARSPDQRRTRPSVSLVEHNAPGHGSPDSAHGAQHGPAPWRRATDSRPSRAPSCHGGRQARRARPPCQTLCPPQRAGPRTRSPSDALNARESQFESSAGASSSRQRRRHR
jgi:hypothetical protein